MTMMVVRDMASLLNAPELNLAWRDLGKPFCLASNCIGAPRATVAVRGRQHCASRHLAVSQPVSAGASAWPADNFIETCQADGIKAEFHEEFAEFQPAFDAATAKKSLQPDRRVRFHMPSSASDDERRQVDEAG